MINLQSICVLVYSVWSLIVGVQNVQTEKTDLAASLVCVCSVRPSENNVSTPTFFPIDSLQKKLKELEEENKSLRSEVVMHTNQLPTGSQLLSPMLSILVLHLLPKRWQKWPCNF